MLQCNLLFERPIIAKALDWEPGVLTGFSALLLTYSDLLPKHFTLFLPQSPLSAMRLISLRKAFKVWY